MRKKVLVLGGNFGGLTAALAVKHELEGDVDVTVVSKDDQFLFNPSLIWLPFGKRDRGDLTFSIGPTLESHDVAFEHERRIRCIRQGASAKFDLQVVQPVEVRSQPAH